MTSIIRVDSIKTAANGTATAASLGIGGTGKIGQVVTATTSTEVANTSASYADVGLSVAITPTATSSKIYVIVSGSMIGSTGSSNNINGFIRILRGSTEIAEYLGVRVDGVSGMQNGFSCSYTDLDSPSTTSAVTYKVQQKLETAGSSRASTFCFNSKLSTITLMEVLA